MPESAARDNGHTPPDGSAWTSYAGQLAEWAWERLVNRTDAWGGYRPEEEWGLPYLRRDGTSGKLGEQTTHKGSLTPAILERHFQARSRPAIVGLHSTSTEATSRWGAIDVDWHGETSTAPETNWRAARAWFAALKRLGFHPLLTDSNGAGGYHLHVLLAEPAPTPRVFWFLKQLVSNHAALGMTTAPETFPKQAALQGGRKLGNWLRLPGRHHKRLHWSRVWNGHAWLEGREAIAFLLGLGSDPVSLLPVDAELRFRIGAYRAKLPNLGEGQGRDDVAFRFGCFLVRDLALSDAEALPWLEEWDQANGPPKGSERCREILVNARRYGQRSYGSGLQGVSGRTCSPVAEPPIEPAVAGEQLTRAMIETLRAHPPLARVLSEILRDAAREDDACV